MKSVGHIPVLNAPVVDVKIFDGQDVVHLLQPKGSATFDDYAKEIFLLYLEKCLHDKNRGDIVWDVYHRDSLKQVTHTKHGKEKCQCVVGRAKIPRNWEGFLRQADNKEELFSHLTQMIINHPFDCKELYVTDSQNVLFTAPDTDLDYLQPCTHEEADSRMILHAYDAASKIHSHFLIRTVYTDVVVLAIANAYKLLFGKEKKLCYLALHEMAAALGPHKCLALPMFHTFT